MVQEALDTHYPDHYLPIGGHAWLVSAQGQTVRQVATKLRLGDAKDDEETTVGIVISAGSYYGRQHSDVWEWFDANQ